ncbi:titin isoform X2 [Bicyclus anynana]|uniref:Titin isoform X2 n=1 Tax=Bicyclus anynana TaxID=110368 RepID=A0A6J1P0M8_BICAN|nr:titin isoform X2 [Bicyclus anynana]
MSDNEDLLGEDLGDHSLADYNLGNEEEDQLLADDYDCGPSHNVPSSLGRGPGGYSEPGDIVPNEYGRQNLDYGQPVNYMPPEAECVVPNITVEVPIIPQHPERSTYAPYNEHVYEQDHAVVPPPIPAAPVESPQIVPSELSVGGNPKLMRERLPQRVYTHRAPLPRNIPDSLDKVFVPRNAYGGGRGRNSWRNPQYRQNHPYRRNNVFRANFTQRPSFPPPQIRPQIPNPPQILEAPPEIRPEITPQIPRELSPERPPILPPERPVIHIEQPLQPERMLQPDRQMIPPERQMMPSERQMMPPDRQIMPPERHMMPPERQILPPNRSPDRRMMSPDRPGIPGISPERPVLNPERLPFYMDQPVSHSERPNMHPERHPDRPDLNLERPVLHPDRPDIHLDRPIVHPDRPISHPDRPVLHPDRPMLQHEMPMENQNFPRFPFRNEERFGPNVRPNFGQNVRPHFERPMYYRPYNPRPFGPPIREINPNNNIPQVTIRQPLPMLPPMKGREREPEVRMLPVMPPNLPNLPPGGLAGKKVLINPHFKGNFQPPVDGPIKDIDDAAERFIAEQRNALARAAVRKFARRSPQRYIENTTIEIENDLARGPPPPRRRSEDEDLLRRQEEFISANRAGLRRRMRSPSPPPRRSPERRPRPPSDEDSEYRRKLREQEALREHVLRAKEVRRRKNAVALQKHLQEREKDKEGLPKPEEFQPIVKENRPTVTVTNEMQQEKPDTTRKTPEREKLEPKRDRSPIKVESAEANSTCGENLTPPHESVPQKSPERALTPPLPKRETKNTISDDELDLILDDIDDILSDEDDSGRFKEKPKKVEPAPKVQVDLRSKLPPKHAETKRPRQKIVFNETIEEKKKKEKSPVSRTAPSLPNKSMNTPKVEPKLERVKPKVEVTKTINTVKSRQQIIFDNKEKPEKDDDVPKFPNRRVILQRKIQTKEKSVFSRIDKNDPTQPHPGIFSRAVRTAIGSDKTRIVVKNEPSIEYESGSDIDEDKLLEDYGNMAIVTNLPHGMTDTRLNTLAGNDVQNLSLDKEERSAKITFKTTIAAENFKKKFNNKMVAASRLTVTLK